MWEADSSDYSSVTSSSDSDLPDLSSIWYGMKQTLPSTKYRLGDNFAECRDMAAQRVMARMTSNLHLRNPARHPASGDCGSKLGWNIPITPEPPRWMKKPTAKNVSKGIGLGDKRMAAAKTLYLRKKTFEKNSFQAHPSKPLPKITPVSTVQYKKSQLYLWDQHDEPPALETRKTPVLPPIGPSSSHHAIQNKHATHKKRLEKQSQPKMKVAEALRLLGDEDWKKKISGIDTIFSLISYHPEAALLKVGELRTAVMKEVTNLRPAVSLAAIKCLDVMFSTLQSHMDRDLHQTVRVLLHKTGESNTFIGVAVDSALSSMVYNVTPSRALAALIQGGLCDKNSAVRAATAKHLAGLVDRMGPEYFLSGKKGITDKAIPAVAKSVQDSSPQARMYGRKILSSLAPHPRLGTMLAKYVPPKDLPAIKLLLNKCSS